MIHIGWCSRDGHAIFLIQCDQCGSSYVWSRKQLQTLKGDYIYPRPEDWASMSHEVLSAWVRGGNSCDGERHRCAICSGKRIEVSLSGPETTAAYLQSWEEQT